MRCNAVVYSIGNGKGTLCLKSEKHLFQIPLGYLPDGCKVGDVLEINISFDPFKTLEQMENLEKEK